MTIELDDDLDDDEEWDDDDFDDEEDEEFLCPICRKLIDYDDPHKPHVELLETATDYICSECARIISEHYEDWSVDFIRCKHGREWRHKDCEECEAKSKSLFMAGYEARDMYPNWTPEEVWFSSEARKSIYRIED